MGYSVDGCVKVLGGGRGLVVVGVGCRWVGALGGGCGGCGAEQANWLGGCRRLVCVRCSGWCLIGVGIELVDLRARRDGYEGCACEYFVDGSEFGE